MDENMSSRFFKNQPNEICTVIRVKRRQKAGFLSPTEKLQNHSNKGKGKGKKGRARRREKKQWLHS